MCRVWQGGSCGIGECDGVYAAAAVYVVSSVCVRGVVVACAWLVFVCVCVCVSVCGVSP